MEIPVFQVDTFVISVLLLFMFIFFALNCLAGSHHESKHWSYPKRRLHLDASFKTFTDFPTDWKSNTISLGFDALILWEFWSVEWLEHILTLFLWHPDSKVFYTHHKHDIVRLNVFLFNVCENIDISRLLKLDRISEQIKENLLKSASVKFSHIIECIVGRSIEENGQVFGFRLNFDQLNHFGYCMCDWTTGEYGREITALKKLVVKYVVCAEQDRLAWDYDELCCLFQWNIVV